MAKVFHLTLVLETEDDAPHPEDWDWLELIAEMPEVQGFSLIGLTQRPYATMEDDPSTHVHH